MDHEWNIVASQHDKTNGSRRCPKMTDEDKQVTLNEKEIKTLIAIMKFSIDACPLASVSNDFEIDSEQLEALISKLDSI